jgi:hypothetical protein
MKAPPGKAGAAAAQNQNDPDLNNRRPPDLQAALRADGCAPVQLQS